MRRPWLLICAVVVVSCTIPTVKLDGKRCTASGGCPGTLPCNPYTFTCTTQPGCPLYPPEVIACTQTDLYLSPSGSDANPGTAQAPRQTLNGLTPQAGTVIHLATGNYGSTLDPLPGGGGPGCPVTLEGPKDRSAVLASTTLNDSHWRLRDLTFNPPPSAAVPLTISNSPTDDVMDHLLFERTNQSGLASGATDVWNITGPCIGCIFVNCDFQSGTDHFYEEANGGNTTIRGSRFSGYGIVWSMSPGMVFEGNDVSGTYNWTGAVQFTGAAAGTAKVLRNTFHDLTGNGPVVQGAAQVISNTFIRIGAAYAADQGIFRNNLLSRIPAGLNTTLPSTAGYNLFDGVSTPYVGATPSSGLAPTDVTATTGLDSNLVPTAGSAPVDAADPALPVPPGGGKRADIGARELGATPLPNDGRYCVPQTP